jgi:hypothetical protein
MVVGHHTVEQGEHLTRIAASYGVTANSVWAHPENAALRSKRKNMNVLYPGDKIYVPDREIKAVACQTDQRHTFRMTGTTLSLRLILKDVNEQPIANTTCSLWVDGTHTEITTDTAGAIERRIPSKAEHVSVQFRDPASGQDRELQVEIGHLDPVEEQSGLIGRLNNLGYRAADSGELDVERLRAAIEEFQCDHQLPITGSIDAATLSKLKDVHGS